MSFMGTVLAFVIANPDSDLRAITGGVGLDPARPDDRNQASRVLGMLVFHNKLERTGMRRASRWKACRGVTLERIKPGPKPRVAAAPKGAPAPRPKKYRAPATAAVVRKLAQAKAQSTAVPVAAPSGRCPPPKPPADSPMRTSLISAYGPTVRRRAGELTSDEIAADVAEFLRRGGRIEQLAIGAASKPLRSVITDAAHTAVNERSWRERQRRLAEQAATDEDDDGDLAAA